MLEVCNAVRTPAETASPACLRHRQPVFRSCWRTPPSARGGTVCLPGHTARVFRLERAVPQRHTATAAAAQEQSGAQTIQLPSLAEAEQIVVAEASEGAVPAAPGIYAVYNPAGELQYVGMSRKVVASVATHAQELPGLVHSVKCAVLPVAGRELLTASWKVWIQEAVNTTGGVPPGNAKGNTQWSARRKPKPEIKLTPGKGVQDLTVPLSTIISDVVKTNKVVAFVKGTRTQPQCGFSHRVLSMLNELHADYEVVNVLDELYNPGLREEIKNFSQWPTIPQVYINGEFVGGADVLEEMHSSGELKAALT